jgi:hypothetical protein
VVGSRRSPTGLGSTGQARRRAMCDLGDDEASAARPSC